MDHSHNPAPLSAVVSAARSGSTWLGSIVNTVPTVAYRFEPWHRSGPHSAVLRDVERRIETGTADRTDRQTLYDALRPANLSISKPPFFPKQWWRRGHHPLWVASRALPRGEKLYRLFDNSPPRGTPVVFKEISIEHHVESLIRQLGVPVVYLVRHPCGSVLSDWRGQQQGAMPTGRQRHLREFLETYAPPDLAEQFMPRLAGMDDLQRSALLWRCDAETALSGLDAAGDGHIVIYEQLCDDTVGEAEKVLGYLGLEAVAMTHDFINRLHEGRRPRLFGRDAFDSFFTVYRNPAEQRDRWMSEITAGQRRAVEEIVHPSWAFQRLAAQGAWA